MIYPCTNVNVTLTQAMHGEECKQNMGSCVMCFCLQMICTAELPKYSVLPKMS